MNDPVHEQMISKLRDTMKKMKQVALVVKNPPANTGDIRDKKMWVQSLGRENPLE